MFIARHQNTTTKNNNTSSIEESLKPKVTVAYVDSPAILADTDPKHTANKFACLKSSHQRHQSNSTHCSSSAKVSSSSLCFDRVILLKLLIFIIPLRYSSIFSLSGQTIT
jgi:hypothetical protein